MQLAHWISKTEISWLVNLIPPWMGMWFAVFPTYETIAAQLIAAVLVIGSYYAARYFGGGAAEASVDVGVPPAAMQPTQLPLQLLGQCRKHRAIGNGSVVVRRLRQRQLNWMRKLILCLSTLAPLACFTGMR